MTKYGKKIDIALDQIIPTIFPDSLCNKLTPTELSQKFDVWLYNFFIDRFGNKPEKGKKKLHRENQGSTKHYKPCGNRKKNVKQPEKHF